jgi:hypothetical protein
MQMPVAPADAQKASAATGRDTAVQAAPVKTAAVAQNGIAVTGVKVLAPDNARWGEGAGANPAAALQQQADAAPQVNDPQSAPVPTEPPKVEAQKTEAPKKLAYAAPSQAAYPVDKAVTASVPPAGSSRETALPGVDPNPLSVPTKSASATDDVAGGGYMSIVNTDVRLHTGPSNGSRSIGVVPRKATVQVLSCQGWCKVSYEGKEGFVFKSFLGRASAPAPVAPEKVAQGKAAPQAVPAAVAPATQTPQNAAKPAAVAPVDAKALEAAADRTMMGR